VLSRPTTRPNARCAQLFNGGKPALAAAARKARSPSPASSPLLIPADCGKYSLLLSSQSPSAHTAKLCPHPRSSSNYLAELLPIESAPNIDVTMKYVQDRLKSHGEVAYTVERKDSLGNLSFLVFKEQVLGSDIGTGTCKLSLRTVSSIKNTPVKKNSSSNYLVSICFQGCGDG
jgi:hypothetical protein